jgi:hypothetical protein
VDNQGPHGAFLLEPLRAAGLPAAEARLDSADLAFEGRGAKGTTVSVGVEFKRLDSKSSDLVQSLRSGRLAGLQLPKMIGPHGAYDYAWLLVEGDWRHDEQGRLEARRGGARGAGRYLPIRGGMSAVELDKQLFTLELCGGLHMGHTTTRRDSVRFLSSLYHWWSDVALDKHTSHLAVYTPAALVQLSPFRAAACAWPGVSVRTSLAAEKLFGGSVGRASAARVKDWAELTTTDSKGQTRRFGTAHAERLIAFFKDGRQ